jgi:hypothetical protein
MRKTLMAALGAAVLSAAVTANAAPAAAGGLAGPDITRAYPGESYAQAYYGRRYYGGGPRYYRRGNGGAAAAGVIGGLAAGAIIGGAIASQGAQAGPLPKTQDPDFIAYCSRRYRSFDPIDGTFLARDGNRYECEYP